MLVRSECVLGERLSTSLQHRRPEMREPCFEVLLKLSVVHLHLVCSRQWPPYIDQRIC